LPGDKQSFKENLTASLKIEPQSNQLLRLEYPKDIVKHGNEYFLHVSFHLKGGTAWAEKGYPIAAKQIRLDMQPNAKVPFEMTTNYRLPPNGTWRG